MTYSTVPAKTTPANTAAAPASTSAADFYELASVRDHLTLPGVARLLVRVRR